MFVVPTVEDVVIVSQAEVLAVPISEVVVLVS